MNIATIIKKIRPLTHQTAEQNQEAFTEETLEAQDKSHMIKTIFILQSKNIHHQSTKEAEEEAREDEEVIEGLSEAARNLEEDTPTNLEVSID